MGAVQRAHVCVYTCGARRRKKEGRAQRGRVRPTDFFLSAWMRICQIRAVTCPTNLTASFSCRQTRARYRSFIACCSRRAGDWFFGGTRGTACLLVCLFVRREWYLRVHFLQFFHSSLQPNVCFLVERRSQDETVRSFRVSNFRVCMWRVPFVSFD